MENKIGEIVTLPFCDTKVRIEESPCYSNPLNLLISRCKGCYYENQEDVCDDYQDCRALGECYHICREDQKDIIFKPLSEDDNQSSCINQTCINQSCINQSCNQNIAPINHVKTIEERASEAGTISQYKSDYRYDKKSVEYGYIQGAGEQKVIDDELCKSGEASDGYHTFKELYDFRREYNAALVNSGVWKAHKSHRHYDGELCFGGGWFIVMINTPFGQISNHYENEYWDEFHCEEKEIADEWDGHTEKDVLERLHCSNKNWASE